MLIETTGIKYLASPALSAHGTDVAHGFFTRVGGVSPAPFNTLNFDTRTGDTAGNAGENTSRAARAAGFSADTLSLPLQVHGARTVALVEKAGYMQVEADAVASSTPGLAIGILTADCLPILLFDPVTRSAAVVHAGWRGTVAGVAASAVNKMAERFGSRPSDIVAALGPHIRPCCYTVGAEVREEFEKAFGPGWHGLGGFSETEEGALTLDLARANAAVLADAGVDMDNMDSTPATDWCTSCRTDLFFSYRREVCVGGQAATGRQLSVIMLRSE